MHLGARRVLAELLFRDKNRPSLTSFTEHLLGLKELTLIENHSPYGLGRCGCGIVNLFDSIDKSDGDLGRVVVGSAFDLDLTSRVGLFGLGSIALCQEFHA